MTASPLHPKVTGVFIPVGDIARARAWYRDRLDLPVGEILFGHLCCVSLPDGLTLLLDQKLTPDGPEQAPARGGSPLFMFAADDIQASLRHLRGRGVEVVEYGGEAVQNGHWFNVRDCEGNLLMICAPSR